MNVQVSPSVPEATIRRLTLADSWQSMSKSAHWVWHGYLPSRGTVLLTGEWSCGKSTLAAVLLAHMATGGELAGQSVRAGRAIILTALCKVSWRSRREIFGIGSNVRVVCRPFDHRPSPADWRELVNDVALLHNQQRVDLMVIDSLSSFLPGNEGDATVVLDFLTELRRLTTMDLCVLLLHDTRAGKPPPRRVSRGRRALTQSVDVILELARPNPLDFRGRQRRLCAFSPFPEAPARRLIELTPDWKHYVSLGDFADSSDVRGRDSLFRLLETADRPLTTDEIVAAWPAGRRPHAATVWRWLQRAVEEGKVEQSGRGLRNDPYVYAILRARSRQESRF